MRARRIAARHESRKPGLGDTDPLVSIDEGHLKLDGTENDDDDDQTTENKLFILVGVLQLCLREKEVSEYPRHGWCPCWVHLGVTELQIDGEPSIVVLKIATLMGSPFVELVLRCGQCLQDWERWLDGEMRSSGRARSSLQSLVHYHRVLDGIARTSSIFIMTTDGVVKAAGFSQNERGECVECRELECSSWSPLGCQQPQDFNVGPTSQGQT